MGEVTYRVMLSMLQEYGLSNDFDVKRTHMLHIASTTRVIDVQTTRNTNTAQGRLYKTIHLKKLKRIPKKMKEIQKSICKIGRKKCIDVQTIIVQHILHL